MADTSKCGKQRYRVEISSSVTDSLRSVHGVIYVKFYGRIRIPRISWNFIVCADSVYQALPSPHEREPGFEASASGIDHASKPRPQSAIDRSIPTRLRHDGG